MSTMLAVTGSIALFLLLFYSAHLLIFTVGWLRLRKKKAGEAYHPKTPVTVVIPFRDEAGILENLLASLLLQDYPRSLLEVILVDDHSSDGGFERLSELLEASGRPEFRAISLKTMEKEGSKKAAITTGAELARGELVVVTDADCRMESGWLKAMAMEYEVSGSRMLCGPVALDHYGTFSGAFQEMEFASLVATGAGAVGAGMPAFCNGANMAFEKKAFTEVGGYEGNEGFSSGDDVFLLHKMKKHFKNSSVTFVLNRQAIVRTEAQAGWGAFFRQRLRWASKSRGYTDPFTITTALSVYLLNLALLTLLVSGIFDPVYLGIFSVLFLVKMITDFPIMAGMTSFLRRKRLLVWFVPFELLYVFYSVIAGTLSLFWRGQWKGRVVSRQSSVVSR